VFGPSSGGDPCENESQLVEILERLDGQLTATLASHDAGCNLWRSICAGARAQGGSLMPTAGTGVEVSHAMGLWTFPDLGRTQHFRGNTRPLSVTAPGLL